MLAPGSTIEPTDIEDRLLLLLLKDVLFLKDSVSPNESSSSSRAVSSSTASTIAAALNGGGTVRRPSILRFEQTDEARGTSIGAS